MVTWPLEVFFLENGHCWRARNHVWGDWAPIFLETKHYLPFVQGSRGRGSLRETLGLCRLSWHTLTVDLCHISYSTAWCGAWLTPSKGEWSMSPHSPWTFRSFHLLNQIHLVCITGGSQQSKEERREIRRQMRGILQETDGTNTEKFALPCLVKIVSVSKIVRKSTCFLQKFQKRKRNSPATKTSTLFKKFWRGPTTSTKGVSSFETPTNEGGGKLSNCDIFLWKQSTDARENLVFLYQGRLKMKF